jgi:alkylation response protein AidB-like acyl-CoA dehydrogenase
MTMLIDELELASRVMPGLLRELSAMSVMDLEESGGAALVDLFRRQGVPAFLVPRELGGAGGSLLEMAQILRLVGARCPSLSIMMTMHHHSVAALSRGSLPIPGCGPLLQRIAGDRALVSSAFAEGRPGADILASTVLCTRLDAGPDFKVVGSKRPCSMTHHADFAVVGVSVDLGDGEKGRGIALIDRALGGIRTEDFWPGEPFASTDSHCVVFEGVIVPGDCVLAPRESGRGAGRERLAVAHAEIALSCLFQLMVSASYLGMASRLGEIALQRKAGTPGQRVEVLSRLETAAMSVYHLAQMLECGDFSGYLLARSMLVAHNAGAQIERAVAESARMLGGNVYLASREAQYLVLASRCIHFHPPSDAIREEIVDGFYTEMV